MVQTVSGLTRYRYIDELYYRVSEDDCDSEDAYDRWTTVHCKRKNSALYKEIITLTNMI